MKSYGYVFDPSWLVVSPPVVDGEAVSVEGASLTVDGAIKFNVDFDLHSAEVATNLSATDAVHLAIIASSTKRTWSTIGFETELSSRITPVEIELKSFPSIRDLRLEIIVYVELDEDNSHFVPGRPQRNKSLLARQYLDVRSASAQIPYFNMQVQEFPSEMADSIWEVVFDDELLAELDLESLCALDISRVFAIRINEAMLSRFEEDEILMSIIISDLAIKSIESFFRMSLDSQSELLGLLGGRRPFEGNWLRWLQWQFRDAFGQPFVEANRTSLGIVTSQWNLNRPAVEARLRSKALSRGAR